MKKKFTKNLLCAGMFSIVTMTAHASSLNSITHGLYVLGEVGASFSNNENFGVPVNSPDWSRPQDDLSSRIGNSPLLGAGIGYRFNPLFSADLTYTQRYDFNYDRTFIAADRIRKFDLDDKAVLANVYLHANGIKNHDFGRFDPYIGAGAGIAWNHASDFSSTVISNGDIASKTGTAFYTNESGFAWQLTAGTGFALSTHCMIDVGYRYLNMGKAQTGVKYDPTATTTRALDPLSANNLSTQEVYLDLSYHFATV